LQGRESGRPKSLAKEKGTSSETTAPKNSGIAVRELWEKDEITRKKSAQEKEIAVSRDVLSEGLRGTKGVSRRGQVKSRRKKTSLRRPKGA